MSIVQEQLARALAMLALNDDNKHKITKLGGSQIIIRWGPLLLLHYLLVYHWLLHHWLLHRLLLHHWLLHRLLLHHWLLHRLLAVLHHSLLVPTRCSCSTSCSCPTRCSRLS